MRYSRSVKYRKKYKKIVILTKVLIIWYAMIASVTLLTTNTSAYFSSNNGTSVLISAASSWWDGSELVFVEKDAENIKACAPIEISVEIKNIGKDMSKSSVFEVYYVEHGTPKNPHGELVGVGEIPKLKNNEITELAFEVTENGHYMFKAYQLPEYEGNNDLEIWSKKLHVNCNAAKGNMNEEEIEHDENIVDEVTDEKSTETVEQVEKENNQENHQENESNNNENGDEVEKEIDQGEENSENDESTDENEEEVIEDDENSESPLESEDEDTNIDEIND